MSEYGFLGGDSVLQLRPHSLLIVAGLSDLLMVEAIISSLCMEESNTGL